MYWHCLVFVCWVSRYVLSYPVSKPFHNLIAVWILHHLFLCAVHDDWMIWIYSRRSKGKEARGKFKFTHKIFLFFFQVDVKLHFVGTLLFFDELIVNYL